MPIGARHVLAVDLGTSGPKVAIVREDGAIIATGFESTPLFLSSGGGAEQDPRDWWRAIVGASRQAFASIEGAPVVPDAICCTAQWSGTVAVDEQGSPLMNAIIWMDCRGAELLPPIIGGFPAVLGYNVPRLLRWVRLTGGAPERSGKGPIAHLLFLRNAHPEVHARARYFLEPKDYLNLVLTGVCATSIDSIALHWITDNRDLSNVRYDATLLRWVGLERDRLPSLCKATDIVGELLPERAAELGLPAGIPVVAGTPDLTSAAIGSGAVEDFEVHSYIGTSTWTSCHLPFKKTDIRHNIASLPSALPLRYFAAAAQESGGICLDRMAELAFLGAPAERTRGERLAVLERSARQAVAGAGGLIFLPWLSGERCPVENHRLRGGFWHQSLSSTPADMIRAVYEGVAYNARWLFDVLQTFMGRPAEAVNMIGGGAQSELWCQIYASVLDRPVRQMREPIWANARGAAMLALVALGGVKVSEIAERIPVARVFEPIAADRGTYDRRFEAFLEAYDAQRRWLRRNGG